MHFVTNGYVADLLDVSLEDVEALADELGVPDDRWDDEAIDEARALLDDDDDDDEDDDDDDLEEDDLDEEDE